MTGTTLRDNVVGTSSFSIGALNTSTTFAVAITNGSTPGTMLTAINKVGTGTLTLSGASTCSGGTRLSAGTLNFGSSFTTAGAIASMSPPV